MNAQAGLALFVCFIQREREQQRAAPSWQDSGSCGVTRTIHHPLFCFVLDLFFDFHEFWYRGPLVCLLPKCVGKCCERMEVFVWRVNFHLGSPFPAGLAEHSLTCAAKGERFGHLNFFAQNGHSKVPTCRWTGFHLQFCGSVWHSVVC